MAVTFGEIIGLIQWFTIMIITEIMIQVLKTNTPFLLKYANTMTTTKHMWYKQKKQYRRRPKFKLKGLFRVLCTFFIIKTLIESNTKKSMRNSTSIWL